MNKTNVYHVVHYKTEWKIVMDMNLQKYLSFVKTVEYGSFTKAAEILNYTQSGVSRMIADLEKEWNITLLERSKYGIKPTSDGMKLLPYAKNLCAEFDKLQMQIDEINGLDSGLIRIGTFSSVATHWLPNIIKECIAEGTEISKLLPEKSQKWSVLKKELKGKKLWQNINTTSLTVMSAMQYLCIVREMKL